MKNVLQGYVGAPEQVRVPSAFADMLHTAGKNMRGNIVSVLGASDWQAHRDACASALHDEALRLGVGRLTREEEQARLRVESTAMVVQVVTRRMLEQLGVDDVGLLHIEPAAPLDLGAGYSLRRQNGGNGLVFHNHAPHSGFAVDMAVESGEYDKLLMLDATGSWESHHANIETDTARLAEARRLIGEQRGRGRPGYDLHVVDVLVNDGEVQRLGRTHKPNPAVHTATLPLRTEAYEIAARMVKKVG